MENIYDQLKQEHEMVKKLFKKAEECPVNKRLSVLEEIETNLVPHSRGEEKTIYSVARQRAKKGKIEDFLNLTNEAYEEHHVADELLAELKSFDVKSERWLPFLKVLKENIEHHIKEEENELFNEAKKVFDSKEEGLLLEDYLEAKQNFMVNLPSQARINERSPSAKTKKDFMLEDQTL